MPLPQKQILEKVTVEVLIEGLLAATTVTQTYRNPETQDIEAVYTFPLPPRAVLVGLHVTIGNRRLKGVIRERGGAAADYEDAGDGAVMLERIDDGLCTMNVGNILPRTQVEVTFTWAEILRWQDATLRYTLPTAVAPRYGEPAAGLAAHHEPVIDPRAENLFSLRLTVHGELASCRLESPSHRLQPRHQGTDETVYTLARRTAFMDRDFVCILESPQVHPCLTVTGRDLDGWTVLAAFNPELPDVSGGRRRMMTLVIDCSGSMAGDSITQAKAGLLEFYHHLQPQDSVNVLAFGTHRQWLFEDGHRLCNRTTLTEVRASPAVWKQTWEARRSPPPWKLFLHPATNTTAMFC